MRFMGIDYGSKRVGIALSDSSNAFALPLQVIDNPRSLSKLVDELNTVACDNEVTTMVMGESKNFKGEDNRIMADVRKLKELIENNLKLPVVFEPEFMTSQGAARFQGKNDQLDASAAALILQSYLDRVKNL